MKNTNIVFLVYDITNRKSFDDIKKWKELAEEVIDKNRCGIYLLGNKADLYKNIEVPENEAQNFSKKNKLEFRLIMQKIMFFK